MSVANELPPESDRTVAIIGMACRFPMAQDPLAYYRNLEKGVSAIQELTSARWDLDKYYSTEQGLPNKSYSKWCGQVDHIDGFDNDFFNISPREAGFIDPQQRILLEEAWHCIEDAGIPLSRLREKRTAVFVGAYSVDYLQEASRDDKLVGSFSFQGGFKFMLANRISYFFGLTGKSLCIDTACSSSLVAIHEAVQALLAGECDYALVGGTNLSHFPFQYISYSKAHMLSKDGRCKTFDSAADGFVTGEGIGVVLLQRSGEAIAAKNNVYGHIKGTAVNHGGKAKTVTSPAVAAQKELLLAAYNVAGISPETITYIEAHGTGTSLGDPIEVKALTEAFRVYTNKLQFCAIGAVKTNIGHLVAAAGIAGLIKVMMMLRYKKIVPSLNVNVLNPLIGFEHSPFKVAAVAANWEPAQPGLPLRAGISSFGAGGTNAHVVVEEAAAYEPEAGQHEAELFLLSARTPASLRSVAIKWQDFTASDAFNALSYKDICRTLVFGREPFKYRYGALVHNKQEMGQVLKEIIKEQAGEVENTPWYLWCGENNYEGFPPDSIFHAPAYHGKLQEIIGSLSDADEVSRLQTALFTAQWSQEDRPCFSLVLNYCLVNILLELGFTPTAVSGERRGLLLALVVSNMLSCDDAYKLAAAATKVNEVKLSRPSIAFWEPVHNRLIQPLQANVYYLQHLLDTLVVSADACKYYRDKAVLLYTHQFTFKKFIEEWKTALAPAGIDILEYLLENGNGTATEQAITTMCIYCALQQLYRKWDLTEEDVVENGSFYELAKLEHYCLIKKETLVSLLMPQPDLAGTAAEINRHIAEKGAIDRNAGFNFPASLPEIEDFALWYLAAGREKSTWMPDGRNVILGNAPVAMKNKPVAVITAITCKSSTFKALLLKCWQAGLDIHWHKMIDEGSFRKVSLPAYAFERKPFWLPAHHTNKIADNKPFIDDTAPVMPAQEKLFYLPAWFYKAAPPGKEPVAETAANVLIISSVAAGNIVRVLKNIHGTDRVSVIEYGKVTQQVADHYWQIDTGKLEGLPRILDELGNIDVIYFLGGITGDVITDVAPLSQSQEEGVLTLFRLVKYLLQRNGEKAPVKIKVITNNSQPVVPGTVTIPYAASMKGLCKGIARELKNIGISCIDVDLEEFNNNDQAALSAELIKAEPPHRNNEEVALRNGNRYQLALSSLKLNPVRTVFRMGGVYIIIGGGGGIGIELTSYLTMQYKANVVIVGRKPLMPQLQAAIEEGTENGGQVVYIQGDITDAASMHMVVRKTKLLFGKINGVVHSALAMRDKPLMEMTAADFVYALEPKVQGSLIMYKALEKEPLDFLAFFSSAQSLTVHPHLSNYAAACTFKDAYALYLAEKAAFPVKLINWGFWETKNVTDYFQKKIILRTITPQEGMEAIERILAHPPGHVMAFKAEDRFLSAIGTDVDHRLELCGRQSPALLHKLGKNWHIPGIHDTQLAAWSAGVQKLQNMLPHYLLRALHRMNVCNKRGEAYHKETLKQKIQLQPKYARFFDEVLRILDAYGIITWEGTHIKVNDLPDGPAGGLVACKDALLQETPAIRAYVELLDQCMERLPEILKGSIPATGVLFANANTQLVEGIYRDNLLADHYNRAVATVLYNYIKHRVQEATEGQLLEVAEIGAGTGSTSGMVFGHIQEFAANIRYVYTDISKAFIQMGQQEFGRYGFVDFKVMNIEHDPIEQGFLQGSFDVVIATNVLHATRNLSNTLFNIKKLLKTNGWLILNEMTGRDDVLTMTFGLLDGWWLYEDEYNRIKGTPLAGPAHWSFLLRQHGFNNVVIHEQQVNGKPVLQNVIIAESNGMFGSSSVLAQSVPETQAVNEPAPVAGVEKHRKEMQSAGEVKEQVLIFVRECVQHTLNYGNGNIDMERPFSELGIDSILGIELIKRINDGLHIDLSATVIYDYATVPGLSAYILDNFGAAISGLVSKGTPVPVEQDTPVQGAGSRDIAIIGMSGRFPGANNVTEFWANIAAGINAVTEIPRNRWDIEAYCDADRTNLSKTYSRWGGFIKDKDRFDAMFFNISGKEAELSDPQHRLFLEECFKAFEDAGYAEQELNNLKCSVFVGATEGDYHLKLMQENISREAQSFWGNDSAVLAARIAYFLNLKGPAVTINTACSSALVAIHLACQQLFSGESEMAVAGGVFVTNTPNFHILASNAEMLSPEGTCKTFDNDADGFVLGEGVGAIILKPLEKAIDDHDHIYGVIKASGINQDGKTNGISAPSTLSQTELEMAVYKKAGIDPGTIGYIEAHGTGTKLGDPIEITALTSAFRKMGYTGKQTCAIGSVKTNIGHAANAAGIASVIKVLLSLQHRKIAPSLHFNKQNEHIDFANSPFYVSTRLHDWLPVNGAPLRRAAISSFGISGTNSHMVIEEAPGYVIEPYTAPWYIIPLSAKNRPALSGKMEQLRQWLAVHKDTADIAGIAYTLQIGRAHFKHRVALLVQHTQELADNLEKVLQGDAVPGYFDAAQTAGHKQSQTNEQIVQLINDLDNCRYTDASAYKSGLAILAGSWLQESQINWWLLYKKGAPKRISLPPYPLKGMEFVPPPPPPAGIHYYQHTWQQQELPFNESNNSALKDILLFDNNEQLFNAINADNNKGRVKAWLVLPGKEFKRISMAVFEIRPSSQEDHGCLMQALAVEGALPHMLIHYWSGNDFSLQEPALSAGFEHSVYDLLSLLQSLNRATKEPVSLLYIHTLNGRAAHPQYAAVTAFAKSIMKENPVVTIKTIAIEKNITTDALKGIIELERLSKDHEIRYADNKRWIGAYTACSTPVTSGAAMPHGGAYIITGGAGGIGYIFARYLAEKTTGSTIYLVGRSAPDEVKMKKVAALVNAQSLVRYIQADISDYTAIQALIEQVSTETGAVRGVIHAAGVISDALLANKSRQEMEKVLAPKIRGMIHLHNALLHQQPDFFVTFSSLAAVTGNAGQGDYAYANSFMDHFMQYRQQTGAAGKSVSINWPLWQEGGMQMHKEAEKFLTEILGIKAITGAEGISSFQVALQANVPALAVLKGDASAVAGYLLSAEEPGKAAIPAQIQEAGPSKGKYQEHLCKELLQLVAGTLHLPAADLNEQEQLGNYGFDSLSVVSFINKVSAQYHIKLSPSIYYRYTTVYSLSVFLLETYGQQVQASYTVPDTDTDSFKIATATPGPRHKEPASAINNNDNKDIAVIGMEGIFPGSPTLSAFWQHLAQCGNLVREVPEDRWDWRKYAGDPLKEACKMNARWGAFIDNVDKFDAEFFNISPLEAELMDPQHRLFLQTVWKTIEDAGYKVSALALKPVGVFVGASFKDYQGLIAREDFTKAQTTTGNDPVMLANRVSFLLNLNGPSEVISTACSSSLVALNRAVKALQAGECELAIAGGVSLMLTPENMIRLAQLGVLAADGKCKTFDKDADGLVKGEGIGALLLKPLSAAIADSDRIYGVIKGSVVNHGGRAASMTAPNIEAQAGLLINAYRQARVDIATVTYIETHGTGTKLGDPAEVEALKLAFEKLNGKTMYGAPYCGLGSVKHNIGHLEPAAGIAGVIKVLLCMQQEQLPGLVHFKEMNPYLSLEQTPFYLVKTTQPWKRLQDEQGRMIPRRAGISSFGYGGTNAHVVLEECLQPREHQHAVEGSNIMLLSARNAEALRRYAEALLEFIKPQVSTVTTTAFPGTTAPAREQVAQSVFAMLAEILAISVSDLDAHVPFRDYGIEEDNFFRLLEKIKQAFRISMEIAVLAGCTDLNALIDAVCKAFHGTAINGAAAQTMQIGREQDCGLHDIAFTLQTGREAMQERLAIVVAGKEELCRKLEQFTGGKDDIPGLYKGNAAESKGLSHLIKGKRGDAFIREVIADKDLDCLAALWTSGAEINWSLLYANLNPQKISLPAYPFAAQRYWAVGNESNSGSREGYYQKVWKLAPVVQENSAEVAGNIIVLVNSHTLALAHSIFKPANEAAVIIVEKGDAFENRSGAHYTIDYNNAGMGERTGALIAVSCPQGIRAVVDLSDLSGGNGTAGISAAKTMLLQTLIRHYLTHAFTLLHFTSGLVRFKSERAPNLAGAGFSGLVKMLGAEYAHLSAGTIDINNPVEDVTGIRAIVLRELNASGSAGEICYRGNLKYVSSLEAIAPATLSAASLPVTPHKVIVITGGVRGIGIEIAKHLVARGARKLVLMGRETLPSRDQWPAIESNDTASESLKQKIAAITRLEQQGADITLYSGPLNDQEKLDAFFEGIRTTMGPIHGIIHCAGMAFNDNPAFISKTYDELVQTAEPKIDGLHTLHTLLEKDEPAFFLLCSSVSALVPSLGAGAGIYAAANAYMDHFTEYQHAKGNRYFRSIQWPNWKDTGMGLVKSDVYWQSGFTAHTTAQGLQLLEKAFACNRPVLMAGYFDQDRFAPDTVLNIKKQNAVVMPIQPAAKPVSNGMQAVATVRMLKELLSNVLRMPAAKLDDNSTFAELGVNSIILAQLVVKLEPLVGGKIAPPAFFEYPTVAKLARYLDETYAIAGNKAPAIAVKEEAPAESKIAAVARFSGKEKIAVIGIGCNFPYAPDKITYWHNLKEGRNCIREVPASRWDIAKHYAAHEAAGKSISKWGAFLENIAYFDPDYFKIPHAEAAYVDPLIRQFLEVSVQTLRDAGYDKKDLWNKKVGIFVGSRIANFSDKADDLVKNNPVGMGQNFIAAYVSHVFNFRGPNLVVDTACSSSLVSIHLACQSLLLGETEVALAGGVDVLLDEKPYLILSKAGALSPDGRCFTFDERANGFVPGEGAGAVLLKPLSKAVKDGDMIYAVIDASAVNNDGHTMGVTTPNPEAQQDVIEEALQKGNIDPATITYIEAHGTGTLIGDPIELKALTNVFRKYNNKEQFCAVGTVKSNMGHLLSAAGIAGFIKVALCIHHRTLVPTLNCETPNARFAFKQSPFYPNTTLQEWKPGSPLLRAGISAFGFGGTNAHIILSEHELREYKKIRSSLPPVIFNKRHYWINNNQPLRRQLEITRTF